MATESLCDSGAFNVAASMKVGWILQLAVTLMIVVNCEAGK